MAKSSWYWRNRCRQSFLRRNQSLWTCWMHVGQQDTTQCLFMLCWEIFCVFTSQIRLLFDHIKENRKPHHSSQFFRCKLVTRICTGNFLLSPWSLGGAHPLNFTAPQLDPLCRHRTSAYFGSAVQVQKKSILSTALLMYPPPTWDVRTYFNTHFVSQDSNVNKVKSTPLMP